MRVCQRQRRHLWESIREWLLVPPFTHTFLKSPSSRGLSAIAELLVNTAISLGWTLQFETAGVKGVEVHTCEFLVLVTVAVESWLVVLLHSEAWSTVDSNHLQDEHWPQGQSATTHTDLAETHARKVPCWCAPCRCRSGTAQWHRNYHCSTSRNFL